VIDWHDLLTAVSLWLVLEGIMPFLNPAGLRKTLARINEMNDGQLRTVGLISMMLGLVLLIMVKQ